MNNLKFKSGLTHPPLSAESLTGRGFQLFQRTILGGNDCHPELYKANRRSEARTSEPVCRAGSGSYQRGISSKIFDKIPKYQMLKLYKMSQRGTSCANLYAIAVQHDKLYNASHCKSKKAAFTLAEVLITLVIIGVVAALTLPTLMTKYQQHVFANQFKKSLYTISQIVANVRSELGVSKLANYCTEYDNIKLYYNANECGEAINKHLRKTSTKKQSSYINGSLYTINRNNEIVRTYNNKVNATEFDYNVSSMFRVNQLPDGSFLGFNINGNKLNFGVDLNGYKKPNRLGYDIFIFNIKKTNDTITGFMDTAPSNVSDSDAEERYQNNNAQRLQYGSPCNLESTRESNGIGCAWFALRNKCPYDDTKTYWECLK